MTQTFGRKTVLARLLANENITVQQGNFDTASFNPHTRVLSLPFWKDVSNDVYDLLVGHEVSHALFTPANKEAERSKKYPFSYLNIVEDVRIEKLILRKYPGIVGNFKRGYKEMVERDFFRLQDNDPNELGFMDRLNIFAKTRGLIDISFTAEEQVWVDRVMVTETFDEVAKLTEEIALWLKYQEHKQKQQESGEVEVEMAESETDGAGDADGESESEETESDSGQVGDRNGEAETDNGPLTEANEDETFDPDDYWLDEAKTENVLENTQEELALGTTLYVKGLDKKTVDLSTIDYKILIASREQAQKAVKNNDEAFAEFRQSMKLTVGPMIKEFEMRKSAYRAARTRTATKGSLDVNKIHKYRYDDQLFKQVSYLADAKNHGMIMLVDHSGSMIGQMASVRRQILILATFCKRVGIPFEVYGFTTSETFCHIPEVADRIEQKRAHFEGLTYYDDNLVLLELLSSRMGKIDYEKSFRQIFNQTLLESRRRPPGHCPYDDLGYTPLNAAIGAMRVKIKEFRKRNRVEKMNLVVLTDGEDSDSSKVVFGDDMQTTQTQTIKRRNKYILDVDGKTIDMNTHSYGREGMVKMVELIKSMDVKVINFFIHREEYVRGEIKKSTGHFPMSPFGPGPGEWNKVETKRAMREIQETGVVVYDGQYGFDRRFILPTDNQDFNGKARRLDVTEGMTAHQASKALSAANLSKRQGRILAQKFCELVS